MGVYQDGVGKDLSTLAQDRGSCSVLFSYVLRMGSSNKMADPDAQREVAGLATNIHIGDYCF
jgi:hypothetical protein